MPISRKLYYREEEIQVYCGDSLKMVREIPDKSIDLVLIDPPYGIGIDVWDKKVDLDVFIPEVRRVLKDKGFFCFFGLMPTLVDWLMQVKKFFKFKEHICWVKRTLTPSVRLNRGFENIFIYGIKNSKFYKTKGLYSDVKPVGIMYDIYTVKSIQRYIASLHTQLKKGRRDGRERRKKGKCNKIYERFSKITDVDKCPEYVNFTNVWSFLPENQRTFGKGGKEHPTAKPVLLIKRLIEMLTLKGMVVLDCFLGSGTTAVACQELGRRCIGIEIEPQYCEVAKQRLIENRKKLRSKGGKF